MKSLQFSHVPRVLFLYSGMSHLRSFPNGFVLLDLDSGDVSEHNVFHAHTPGVKIGEAGNSLWIKVFALIVTILDEYFIGRPIHPSPEPRWLHSSCLVEFGPVDARYETACIFGGQNDNHKLFSDLYRVHVDVDFLRATWEVMNCLDEMSPIGRCGHTAHAVGSEILIFGGLGDVLGGARFLNDLLLLILSEDEAGYRVHNVKAHGTPPCPRYCHTSAISKDQMFIFGGWDMSRFYGDLHVYCRLSSTWNEVHTSGCVPRPCCQLAATHFTSSTDTGKGYLLLFGGCYRQDSDNPNSIVDFDEFRILDLDLLVWLPIARTLPAYKGALMASVASATRGWILSGGMYTSMYADSRFRNDILFVRPSFQSKVYIFLLLSHFLCIHVVL